MNLTPQASQIVSEIAQRYYVSEDAVKTLLQAVINGGGTMAQFSHPEFGGSGQWMQGGMTMVGDMFNNALKNKVDNLCSELARLSASQPLVAQPVPNTATDYRGNVGLSAGGGGNSWWPADLGSPSSTGSQNNIRYAVFPSTQRLAVEINGQLTIYDTLQHEIGGVSQQQGFDTTLTFTSQYGQVRIVDLPVVSGSVPAPAPAAQVAPSGMEPAQDQDDIFAKIERLAELRQKGILSDDEFANKKADLMSRL